MYLVKLSLRPGVQFHFGTRVLFDQSVLHSTDTQIHSDTLFSALVNIADKIGVADSVVEELKWNPMSSAFYVMENGQRSPVYFLPRPTIPLSHCDNSYKFIKQKAFVSKGIFERNISVNQWQVKNKKRELIAGKNWIATREEMQNLLGSEYDNEKAIQIKLFGITNIPQVRVHTNEEKGNFYQTINVQIADNRDLFSKLAIHFYFLLQKMPSKNLETVFNMLPYEGIGGQRSTGCGQVQTVHYTETNLFDSLNGDVFLALSKIIPTQLDLDKMGENTFYKTTIRGGRILKKYDKTENDVNIDPKIERLKQIRMIDEGAIFEQEVKGRMRDLCPVDGIYNKPYFRYGKAFLLSISKTMSHD